MTGATGPARVPESSGILEAMATTSNQSLFAGLSEREAEMLAGRLENQRRVPPTNNVTAPGISSPSGERIETDSVAAATQVTFEPRARQPANIGGSVAAPADVAAPDAATQSKAVIGHSPLTQQPEPGAAQAKHGNTIPPPNVAAAVTGPTPRPSAALGFLDDFFGSDKRHLVAIKKPSTKGKPPTIMARHFDADDRDGQQKFITDHGTAGFDLYFSPNPIKGMLHKKAAKNDVAEARHFWIDLDPRSDEPLDAERAAMLAQLTTNLPRRVPKPNRVIDSGRGYWGYWKLDKPAPVDGAIHDDKGHFVRNNPLTDIVESHGKGLEEAFGDRFADGCRNIDRIARLPGTINTKAGNLAHVLHDYSHNNVHAIESFPRRVEKPKDQEARNGEKFKPSDKYEPIEPDDPLLAKLDDKWRAMLTASDYAAAHGGDRSRAEIAFAAAAIRAGIDDSTIARCLMDGRRPFGSNTRQNANYLLPRNITRGHEFAIDPDLEEMNSRHCVISDFGGKCVIANEVSDPKSGEQIVTFSSFETLQNRYRNRKRVFKTTAKNEAGEEVQRETKIHLGQWWLDHKQRRQYDTVVFAPGRDIPGAFNLWRGFKYEPDFVKSARKCWLYLKHVHENICQGDPRLFKYTIRWMANVVQNPGVPGSVALVMRGEMGTGKGEAARHFGELFGENFIPVTKAKHITGHFNGHMGKCILLFGDECFNRDNDEQEQILKTLVTERRWLIEFKGFDAKRFDSCLHIMLAANQDWVVPVRLGDRRFCCMETGTAHLRDRPYFIAIDNQMRAGGYAALLGFLLKVDIKDWNPEDIPETKERQFQKWLTASDGDKIVIEFAQDACLPGALPKRPWIARAHTDPGQLRHLQIPGLFDVMKAHGGTKLAHMSDTALADLVKRWGFKAKSLGNGRGWEAPPLPELRKAISTKFPAVEFDDRKEWVAADVADEAGQSPQPAQQTAADTGGPDEADAALDERIANLMSPSAPISEIKPD